MTKLYPLRDLVLIRPERLRRVGSLYVLEERKFGTHGLVVEVGPDVREVSPGDLVLWSPVAIDLDPQYLPYFFLHLVDEDGTEEWVLVDSDAEPIVRGAVHAYRKNPTTGDLQITVRDLNSDDQVRFLTSNVRDFGPVQLTQTGRLKTDYVEAFMIDLWDGSRYIPHFIFHEFQLEAIVHAAD